jgi:hypothetical protein
MAKDKMSSFSEALQSRRAPNDRIETRQPSSIEPANSERERKSYAAAVSLLILEVYTLFDLPLPESEPPAPGHPSEMDLKIGIWMNALIRTVPEDDLRPALDYTIDHHAETRAINAMDIKQNYGAMVVERARKERERERDETLPDCISCENERVKDIWFPATGESVVLPCQACRPKAFTTARAQWLERRDGLPPPAGSVAAVEKVAEMLASEVEN